MRYYVTADNGFNPVWNEIIEFDVANPYFALLRFVVQDEDMFGDSNFIGQATYPVSNNLSLFPFHINYFDNGTSLLASIIYKNSFGQERADDLP